MAHRLTVDLETERMRFPLAEGDNLVGSAEGCAIRIVHPAVSRRHARLIVEGSDVTIEDLGSSNGTRVAGRRIGEPTRVEPGEGVTFGHVKATLESVDSADLEAAIQFEPPPRAPLPATAPPPRSTLGVASIQAFALEDLRGLLALLARGGTTEQLAAAVGASLFERLACLDLEIVRAQSAGDAVLFRAYRGGGPTTERPSTIRGERLELRVELGHPTQLRLYRPLLESCLLLVELADDPPPLGAGSEPWEPTPLPEPPTLDPRLRRLYRDASKVAQGQISVLVCGESGTGKEVFARYLHRASTRSDGPFVALNCAALPRDLLEAELFGIEKGVATGVEARQGRFEQAAEGTLFLDEIGDMALETQAKILRVLQEGEVYRLGGTRPRPARVRVVAATNRDLDELMAAGSFRSDLYHRIADWRLELPPLRERRADVPNLAAYFLARAARERGVAVAGISRGALDALVAYDWPGNVRQLEREMSRASLFLEEGELLERSNLQEAIRHGRRPPATSLRDRVDALEREVIRGVLAAHDGEVEAAAAELGISRATLYRRLQKLGPTDA